jgi:hypothetical protein
MSRGFIVPAISFDVTGVGKSWLVDWPKYEAVASSTTRSARIKEWNLEYDRI